MAKANTAVIQTEGLTKVYGEDRIAVHALRGVDWVVEPGEFTAVVGPSGSGKTTLLNVVSGLDTPTSGNVWLKGNPLSGMTGRALSDFRRDHIGFVFQAYNLIPVLTAAENVEYILLLQGVPAEERQQRVHELLTQVGLEGMTDRRPPDLSGGQQQRVAIARAMVAKPSLILADEPTANLDSETGSQLLNMMQALNQETGMTFVFSTHDRMVMDYARRLVRLHDGQITGDERK
ncbi:MAG: ABC transporter ATP-binding protein [Candidatus Pacebacteria bacterium]|nr:ABC transporter ATP-binding protein [Candidatus Paceibacterota bacterium]